MLAGKNPEPREYHKDASNFNYPVEEYFYLPKVELEAAVDFFHTLNNRVSHKTYSKISIQQLSNLLWYTVKTKKVFLSEKGAILSHRPSPSAGAIHPIDTLIYLPDTVDSRRLYYYDPFSHRLGKLKLDEANLALFFDNVDACINVSDSVLIWFVAHFERTAAKYKHFESLVWRDAGALIMIFQLVATALDIKTCPIGTLGLPFISNCFNSKLVSAGGLIIG